MKKLDKLVLTEFIPLFFVGVLGFTAIMTSFTVFKEAVKYLAPPYDLEFMVVIHFFWLSLPQILVWTFPMGVLLGVGLFCSQISRPQKSLFCSQLIWPDFRMDPSARVDPS